MSDSGLKGRVKGLFGGASPEPELPEQSHVEVDSASERQALQVLILARRTADEHVAVAQHEAERIRSAARAKAEETGRDAQAHAEGVRREAGRALTDAQAKSAQIAKDAQANAEAVRRDADKILVDAQAKSEQMSQAAQANADGVRREADKTMTDARAQAAEIAKDAQATADELERDARQRHQDVVGSLEIKRTELRQQIEALQQFDRDYRLRLATFMQSQLRALGIGDQHSPPEAASFDLDDQPSKADFPSFDLSDQPSKAQFPSFDLDDEAELPPSPRPGHGPALGASTAELPMLTSAAD